jgi:hypothetical protein
MQIFRHSQAMNTALPTAEQVTHRVTSSNGRSFENNTAAQASAFNRAAVSAEDIDGLVVRLAGPADREPLADLETRAGTPRPAGALMVGAIGDRVLAAVSMSNRRTLSEPTPSGAAAVGAVGYTVAGLRRRGSVRRAGTSS